MELITPLTNFLSRLKADAFKPIEWVFGLSNTTTMILAIVVGLFLMSKLYSTLFNVSSNNSYDLSKSLGKIKTGASWTALLLPFIGFFVLLYNIGNEIIWFLGELIRWSVKGAIWVYSELIVEGLFLILRTLWHYLVVWPWTLLKISFSQIIPSAKRKPFLIGMLGLWLAGVLVFAGRYLTEYADVPTYWQSILTLVSLLPLGLAIGKVSIMASEDSTNSKGWAARYIKHFFLLFGAGAAIILALITIIRLSSQSDFSSALSSLAVGGSILGAGLMLVLSVFFVLMLSALPSFSQHFSGKTSQFYGAFWHHLWKNGLRYLIAFPAMLIPAILITIFPYYLSRGAGFLAKKTTLAVIENRSQIISDSLSKTTRVDYESWLDISSINEDSLKILMAADQTRRALELEYSNLTSNAAYLTKFFNGVSDSIGAAPVGAAFYYFTTYEGRIDSATQIQPYVSAQIDTMAFHENIEKSNSEMAATKQEIAGIENEIEKMREELDLVCVEQQPDEIQIIETEERQDSLAEFDECQYKRDQINGRIALAESGKQTLDSQVVRLNLVNSFLKNELSNSKMAQLRMEASVPIAKFILGIWASLLLALSFAFALVLFARVNHLIYQNHDTTNPRFIFDEIETARAKNPNQPLLGLAFWAILFLMYIGTESKYNPINWNLGLYSPSPKTEIEPSTQEEGDLNTNEAPQEDPASDDLPVAAQDQMETPDSTFLLEEGDFEMDAEVDFGD